MTNHSVQEAAAARLEKEFTEIGQKKATGGREAMLRYMAKPVGEMLERFCWQSEDFAAAVAERKATLRDCLSAILSGATYGISDVEAYAAAVKFYMPGAKVRATFRVDAPVETDFDLDPDLGTEADSRQIELDLELEAPDCQGEA